MSQSPSIVIADDHPLFRRALTGSLQAQFTEPKIAEADSFWELQGLLEQDANYDLILLDLMMPGAEGFGVLAFLCAHYSHIPVIVVSAMEQPDIMRRAIDHGAAGFLPKSASIEEMANGVNQVLAGGLWIPEAASHAESTSKDELDSAQTLANLTPQQFKVASMVRRGLLNKQIAYELGVTEATVKAHMTEILRKLGVNSRTQAAMIVDKLAIEDTNKANFAEAAVSH